MTDAIAAVDAGADAVGLVFYSKAARRVSVETAGQILDALPPFVTPVGLFVDSPAAEILDTTAALGIRTVQLHGNETPDMIAQLPGLRIIKAIHVDAVSLESSLRMWREAELPTGRLAGILLETACSESPGGTGIENDWSLIESAQQDGLCEELPPIIVAGGLTAANVGDVVRRLKPYAVDVSSGIEQSKGIKSIAKMLEFVRAVRI